MPRSDNLSYLSVTQSPFPAGTNDCHHSQGQGQGGEPYILQLPVRVWKEAGRRAFRQKAGPEHLPTVRSSQRFGGKNRIGERTEAACGAGASLRQRWKLRGFRLGRGSRRTAPAPCPPSICKTNRIQTGSTRSSQWEKNILRTRVFPQNKEPLPTPILSPHSDPTASLPSLSSHDPLLPAIGSLKDFFKM